jgi:hypothetical protein
LWPANTQVDARLVYLDADGDWIMSPSDKEWSVFVRAATRLLITSRC